MPASPRAPAVVGADKGGRSPTTGCSRSGLLDDEGAVSPIRTSPGALRSMIGRLGPGVAETRLTTTGSYPPTGDAEPDSGLWEVSIASESSRAIGPGSTGGLDRAAMFCSLSAIPEATSAPAAARSSSPGPIGASCSVNPPGPRVTVGCELSARWAEAARSMRAASPLRLRPSTRPSADTSVPGDSVGPDANGRAATSGALGDRVAGDAARMIDWVSP